MSTINSNEEIKLPAELRAVLQIFSYDRELQIKALPHVNIKKQLIDWDRIWENDFSGAHGAAVVWAQAIWCDEIRTKLDPFERAFAMDPGLQKVILKGLAIRWGFKI
ncbi:MAG: hypothetical protein ACXVCR_19360 [Bdellovibrio sp.]